MSPLTVVNSGLCIGCGSCVAQAGCGTPRMEFNRFGELQPSGREWMRAETEHFARTCPFSPSACNENDLADRLFPNANRHQTAGSFLSAYVGSCVTEDFRARGSSGGMVSWMLTELLARGLVDGVAHVTSVTPRAQDEPFFRYRISRTTDEVRQGAKSRYYPVELSAILREIESTPGTYAVVGVPCFIKAIQLLRQENALFRDRIAYTVGLFCGHMKSAQFAESIVRQLEVDPACASAIDFRIKDFERPATTYTAEVSLRDGSKRRRDWWNLADGDWGAGFFQYPACNFCDDVIAEVADVSFGDAWVEPYSSDGRGTNVIVVRSEQIDSILLSAAAGAEIEIEPVDEQFIVQTQEAGFRQRREGLAYRLSRPKRGTKPIKRVSASRPESSRRRLIYLSRASITAWSRQVFRASVSLGGLSLYRTWAKLWVAFYHGFAYSRGKLGLFASWLGLN